MVLITTFYRRNICTETYGRQARGNVGKLILLSKLHYSGGHCNFPNHFPERCIGDANASCFHESLVKVNRKLISVSGY